ncbi:polymorphic toxin-type HINT domain-containing protein [Streptomyces sp. YIM 130001]|uniref:polymorphic toxin-type HINT domain-containing protein n=1 Tax=Streptomyces sp. YIM 130001 TaxID=2259644 RepID=UPI0013C41DEC|nr:polymorphic toxin-type HINT domain-containing protein [Streptomyces sp. YIM 130001]
MNGRRRRETWGHRIARQFGVAHLDRGASMVEYAGVLVLVTAIVVSVMGLSLGDTVAEKVSTQVCRIVGGDCADAGGAQAGGKDSPVTDGTNPGNSNKQGDGAKQAASKEDEEYAAAQRELAAAQKAYKSDNAKAKHAAGELARILSEELGIKDAFDCITKGESSACTETVLNVLSSLVGGAVGKLAKKYGVPWKWDEAADLIKTLKKHGGDLYSGIKGLIKNKKRVAKAEAALKKAAAKACKPKHSFLPGTSVLLADGRRVPIETVDVGDKVLATDPATDTTAARPVTGTITTHEDKHFTRLMVGGSGAGPGNETLTATDTHPFWLPSENRWADAGDITTGDRLRTAEGTSRAVTSLSRYTKRQTTHDLTVAGIHTYYVLAGRTTVLVHNQNCTKPANLPGWRKVDIDIDHVLDRHTAAGRTYRQSGIKTKFPDGMSTKRIKSTIRQAYKSSSIAGRSQGNRVFLRGKANGLDVEMWVNKKTRMIETAYPVWK